MMNRWLNGGMITITLLSGWSSTSWAQSRETTRVQGRPAMSRTALMKSEFAREIRPYGSSSAKGAASSTTGRSQRRPTPPPPPMPERARAAVFSRGVHDYYPFARQGQQVNRNVIDPRSLCVPGRRAMLQR